MIEELPDDIDNDELDDVEPVGDEAQLYEHFRVVVDKGQEMMRVDKYLLAQSHPEGCRCRLRDGERQGCEK